MILTSIGVFCRNQDVCVVVTKCLCMFDSRKPCGGYVSVQLKYIYLERQSGYI